MPGELILIVEDNELNRKLLRDVLQAEGYATIEADRGEDGVEIARTRQPAVVLMDIRLPGMDGVQALRELRNDPRTRCLPVIAVTASLMPTDRSYVTAAGFDGYLTKPLAIDDLLGEVRTALERGVSTASDGGPLREIR